MGAPSPLLRSGTLSQRAHRSAEGRAGRGGSALHAPSSPCTDPTGKNWENAPPPGKINPDRVRKEAQGDGGKSFTFNWTFCCSRWTSGCLLCRGCSAVPCFHHTRGAAGSPLVFWDPQCPGAGLENRLPWKDGHCSTAGLALLPVPFLRDFPFPPCWNNVGAVLDLAVTGFKPEPCSATPCSPLTPLELVSQRFQHKIWV